MSEPSADWRPILPCSGLVKNTTSGPIHNAHPYLFGTFHLTTGEFLGEKLAWENYISLFILPHIQGQNDYRYGFPSPYWRANFGFPTVGNHLEATVEHIALPPFPFQVGLENVTHRQLGPTAQLNMLVFQDPNMRAAEIQAAQLIPPRLHQCPYCQLTQVITVKLQCANCGGNLTDE